jgi:hypothetical protein
MNSRVPAACPSPDPRDHVARDLERPLDAVDVQSGIGFRQRLGHVLRAHRRNRRQTAAGRGDRDQPRARSQRADRREVRRAGLAARSRDDEHAAVVPLVAVRRARRHELAHRRPREQFDARTVDAVDNLAGNADVRNHDAPGVHFGRRQHQR